MFVSSPTFARGFVEKVKEEIKERVEYYGQVCRIRYSLIY